MYSFVIKQVNGIVYRTIVHPNTTSCDGCTGQNDRELCVKLGDYCNDNKVIWILKEAVCHD